MKNNINNFTGTFLFSKNCMFNFVLVVHGMIAMDDVSDNNKIWRMLFAEFLGTAILLFLGCGSIMWLNGSTNSSDIIAISLTFGFTIATLVQVNTINTIIKIKIDHENSNNTWCLVHLLQFNVTYKLDRANNERVPIQKYLHTCKYKCKTLRDQNNFS